MTKVDSGTPLLKLQLAEGARIEARPGEKNQVSVYWQAWAVPLGGLTRALRDAAAWLADGVDEEYAASYVRETEGLGALARWSLLVQTLLDAGSLRCTLSSAAGDPLATISALAPGPTILLTPFRSADPVTISRFAFLRASSGMLVLRSPLGRAQIQLHDPRLSAAVAQLALPSTVDQLTTSTGLGTEISSRFPGLFAGRKRAGTARRDGRRSGPSGASSLGNGGCLVFMSTAGSGGGGAPTAQRTASVAAFRAPPAIAPSKGWLHPTFAGSRPGQVRGDGSVFHGDPGGRAVAANVRSRARPQGGPTEFLYRSTRNTRPPQQPATGAMEMAPIERPYPGAGGCHPLELYIVAHHCADLARPLPL